MEVIEISTDPNNVLHIEGYTLNEEEEGCTMAYVFNKEVYYTNPLFRYNSLVVEVINDLRVKGVVK